MANLAWNLSSDLSALATSSAMQQRLMLEEQEWRLRQQEQRRMRELANMANIQNVFGRTLAMDGTSSNEHLGMVKELRKKFKQYSKEEFRNMSKAPIIKDILAGSHKLSKTEIGDRIEEHLKDL